MALIKTVAEIRSVIPRLSKLSDEANLPNLSKGGRVNIIPIIGKELYSDLDKRYNALAPDPVLTELETELITTIQLPLAAFTLLADLPFLHTVITDNGIRTANTDKFQAAHRWEFNELRNALADYAADGVEILLDFLYTNKGDLPKWTNSESFKELDDYLIKTGTDFRRYYPLVQPLRTFWAMKPVLWDIEENYLSTCLGRDLLAWIKTQQTIIVTGDGGEVDVVKLLKKATAHLAIRRAGDQLAVQFSQEGFTVLSITATTDNIATDGKQNASLTQLKLKLDAAEREGQNFLSKAASYLVGIANGEFNNDFGPDFTTAFDHSPLKKSADAKPYSPGNDRRKIFRMP